MIVGFIGLGTMGEPMCMNILKKAQGIEEVLVYDFLAMQMDLMKEDFSATYKVITATQCKGGKSFESN